MNENVKIKITEIDTTSPAGRGTDSTDIAFIPGFSCLTTAPVNTPVLCTTLKEFEEMFGTKPVMLTYNDVADYTEYGFRTGQYDTGYVFAKELLCQGLSVVYCNVGNYTDTGIINTTFTKGEKDAVTLTQTNIDSKNNIKVKLNNTFEDDVTLTGEFTIKATKGTSSFEADGVIISGSTVGSIKELSLKKSTNDKSSVEVRVTGNTVEFEAVNEEDVVLEMVITLSVKGLSNDEFVLEVFENTGSRLDVFYEADTDGKYPIETIFDTIADKSIYSVKYITSGGYPSVVDDSGAKNIFAYKMLNAAAERGDAVALIDYMLDSDDVPFATDSTTGSESYYEKMLSVFTQTTANAEFGAAMYPWATYTCANSLSFKDSTGTLIQMPASFAYLICLAKAIKRSPNWLAMAGVTRGLVPSIRTLSTKNGVLSNAVAENMQPKFGSDKNYLSINCITDIKPYGLTLWGNRTLKPVGNDGTVALNFLNTRNMLSDIKKLLYTTAKSLMFEQNSNSLWLRFKAGVSPLLNELKSGNGISDFKIIKGTTKYNGDPLQKGEMAAVIKIYPIYAVEYFELTVEISDEDVTVS